MNESSLRELGMDLIEERQFERALAVFAEAVRRVLDARPLTRRAGV